jgi:hypothetical protein
MKIASSWLRSRTRSTRQRSTRLGAFQSRPSRHVRAAGLGDARRDCHAPMGSLAGPVAHEQCGATSPRGVKRSQPTSRGTGRSRTAVEGRLPGGKVRPQPHQPGASASVSGAAGSATSDADASVSGGNGLRATTQDDVARLMRPARPDVTPKSTAGQRGRQPASLRRRGRRLLVPIRTALRGFASSDATSGEGEDLEGVSAW